MFSVCQCNLTIQPFSYSTGDGHAFVHYQLILFTVVFLMVVFSLYGGEALYFIPWSSWRCGMPLENRHCVQSSSRHMNMELRIGLKPVGVSVNWMATGHKQHFYLLLDLNIKISRKILTWFSPQNLTDTEFPCTNLRTSRGRCCCGQDASRRRKKSRKQSRECWQGHKRPEFLSGLWRGKQSAFELCLKSSDQI